MGRRQIYKHFCLKASQMENLETQYLKINSTRSYKNIYIYILGLHLQKII